MAFGFFLIALSELVSTAALFRDTAWVSLYRLVSPFGMFWMVEHALLCVGIIIISRWVFAYLFKQFHTQLFMIITTMILVIFLVTTVSFSGLLVKNVQDESLRQLETDVLVLRYSLESKKSQLVSDAQMISQNQAIIQGVTQQNRMELAKLASEYLLTKKQSTLLVVNESGQLIARGEDRDRIGESLSGDTLVKRALLGESVASVVTTEGVVAPMVSIRAAVPIRGENNAVIGAVIVGEAVDSAYVDGLKKATGLDASIYADMTVSATTFLAPDGASRMVGMKENSSRVKDRVLKDTMQYTGSVPVLGTPYFASFLPLADADNVPVGMLFVGRPQVHVLAAAGRSIELTFLVTSLLLVLSIVPAFMISTFISSQLE